MGYRGCGGHQRASFQRAKGAAAEVKERVEFPVVRLGSGNYAKLLERVGRVPRVVMMVHFEPGVDGERAAARIIEGARGARADLELVVWASVSGALLQALEEQAARLGADVGAFLVGPRPAPPKAKPWSKKKSSMTGEQMRKYCKPLAIVLPTLEELEARESGAS